MKLRFRCPNGHKLNAEMEFAGKSAFCPKCATRVTVPQAPPVRHVSDSSVMRMLGDFSPSNRFQPQRPAEQSRVCPKCSSRIPSVFRSCPQCGVYLPGE